LFNYGLTSYGKLFLEKFKKRPMLNLEELRNGQRLENGIFLRNSSAQL
jgi:hypothetical protein